MNFTKLDNLRLSANEIRRFNGFENTTDKEANAIGDLMLVYATILYNALTEQVNE